VVDIRGRAPSSLLTAQSHDSPRGAYSRCSPAFDDACWNLSNRLQ